MIYAMMNKTTNWMPLVRHKRSQNPPVVYPLVDEVMAVGDIPTSSRVKEQGRLPHEGGGELKQRAMPGGGIGQQDRVGQVLGQQVRVPDRNHRVSDPTHHEARLGGPAPVAEPLAPDPPPGAG